MVMTVLVTGVGCHRGQSHSEHPLLPRRRRSGPGNQPPLPVSESVSEASAQLCECPAGGLCGQPCGQRRGRQTATQVAGIGPGAGRAPRAGNSPRRRGHRGCWDVLYGTSESSTKTVPRNPRTGLGGWGRPDPREKRDVSDENKRGAQ